MPENLAAPQRRSVRLAGYDYAMAGAYFVTICTAHKQCLFGSIANDCMVLNAHGQIAEGEWLRSAELRPGVELDEFVIMPNHLHGIVVLADTRGARGSAAAARTTGDRRSPLRTGPASQSLGAIIAGYKAAVTKHIWVLQGKAVGAIWQRSYYEHVVRNEADLARIRMYIASNPLHWALDSENPDRS